MNTFRQNLIIGALVPIVAVITTGLIAPIAKARIMRNESLFEQQEQFLIKISDDFIHMREKLLVLEEWCNKQVHSNTPISQELLNEYSRQKQEILMAFIMKTFPVPILFNEKISSIFREFNSWMSSDKQFCSEQLLNSDIMLQKQIHLLLSIKKEMY